MRGNLYVYVVIAVLSGMLLGYAAPHTAIAMKPLADGFINLIKLLVGPIIFCSIVHGIAALKTMGDAGRIGGKAMLYFFAMSSLSLVLGLAVTHLVGPGMGMHVDAARLDASALATTTHGTGMSVGVEGFLLHIIPASVIEPFAAGDILQILFLAILTAAALVRMGARGQPIIHGVDAVQQLLFTVMEFVMRLAPVGAFGAMAFTVGQYGIASLLPLGSLLLCFYATCALFIIGGLGLVLRSMNISLWRFLSHIKQEIFVTFGTSSSESALPSLLVKLEQLGCSKSVVGMVLPTGYSFNLDGTAIYLTLAATFLAQATDTPMTWVQQLTMLGVMLLTSKGAAGVTGAGFVTLSATLATMGSIPVASLALILGVDRFMSEGRAVTNVIGNAVATVVVARWERALDRAQLDRQLG
jgi:aerobic C4-dicarboxylate transport protein